MHHRQKLLNPKHPTRIDAFPQNFLRAHTHTNFAFGGRPSIQVGKSSPPLTAYFLSSLMRIRNSIRPSSDPSSPTGQRIESRALRARSCPESETPTGTNPRIFKKNGQTFFLESPQKNLIIHKPITYNQQYENCSTLRTCKHRHAKRRRNNSESAF